MRRGHWWHVYEVLGTFCAWWRGHGATVQPTFTIWFKLVPRAGWSTWPTRDGGAAQRDSEPAPEIVELVHSSSTSSMSLIQGGRDLPSGKGGREEARGGSKGGEGAQGGAEGTVDGNIEGAGLGKERQMPYRTIKKDLSVLQSRC